MGDGSNDQDRLFVRDGFRHYRRRYSLAEVRWGLACGAALLGIALWVAWRGRQPDPELFADGSALLQKAPSAKLPVAKAPPTAGAAPTSAADRGPLPAGLAAAGWREDKTQVFDAENLYVKINGRADYFMAFGFKRLYNLLLVGDKDPATTIDIEVYDQGSASNALGAYGGERAPTIRPTAGEDGLHHLDRNALYLARGPYYIRVIGSSESPEMTRALEALAGKLISGVKGEPLPWAYGVFVGQMGLDPGQLSYFAENAFSLGFARDVWTVRPAGKDADLEIFVAVQETAPAARAFADKLRKAFLELGSAAGRAEGVPVVKDQFLGLISGAGAEGRFAYGVRGAADLASAGKELARLRQALADAPAALLARARPAPKSAGESSEYE